MLKISRPDIECESITDFPIESRFIKLPIVNYLKLLGAYEQLNRAQRALINAINSPNYRFICAALSRRLGKTYIANAIAQLVSLVPYCNILIISPNYSLSSISFELQRKFIKQFDLEVERDNLKDKIIELSNGSTIRMASLTTVDAAVGRSYDLIIFDEAALGAGGEEAFNIQLRPTLDKINSKAIFISTPRGKLNWFSRFYDRGFDSRFPEWVSIQADYHENPRMNATDIEEARRIMTTEEFEQEYCASFNQFVGQIFKFNDEHIIEWYENDDVAEIIAGCDPGYNDPTAYIVVAYRAGIFHVIDEYLDRGVTEQHARAFKEFEYKYGIEINFIDSAAAQFGADMTYMYDISMTKAKKDVLPGIAYVQNLIEKGRLLVDPRCIHTLAMLDQYRWDDREGLTKAKPVHDDYSHMADALRYALYSFVIDDEDWVTESDVVLEESDFRVGRHGTSKV